MDNLENLLVFIAVLGVAFASLQLILFFKIWAMTNDVKKIRMNNTPSYFLAAKEVYKNNPDISNILFDSYYADVNQKIEKLTDIDKDEEERLIFKPLKKKYKELYQQAGVDMPVVFESINSKDKWLNTFKLK